jgi:succinate-semialdehyde dehydrogenase/glutarate-semialdehyde dehydrogenase
MKRVSLELGGNAPFIVFDDADLDAAVNGAIASKYRNTGQTCVCANRLFVQSGVYEAFARKLADAVAKLRIGDGLATETDQGPLIDTNALLKVEEHVADALAKGARVLSGGKRHALGGTFYEPTLLADVDTRMLIAREETFGPVAPLFRFDTEGRGHRLANDTESGLAAYMYTRDLGALLARGRGAGVRHRRHQHRADFQRSRAVRRHQAIRLRTRRVPSRHQRLPGHQVRLRGHRALTRQGPVQRAALS